MTSNGWSQQPNFSSISTVFSNSGDLLTTYSSSSNSNGVWYANTATGVYFLATNSSSTTVDCSQSYNSTSGYSNGSFTSSTTTSDSCVPAGDNAVTYNSTSNSWSTPSTSSSSSSSLARSNGAQTTISVNQDPPSRGDAYRNNIITKLTAGALNAAPLISNLLSQAGNSGNTVQIGNSLASSDISRASALTDAGTGLCTDSSNTTRGANFSFDGDGLLSVTGEVELMQAVGCIPRGDFPRHSSADQIPPRPLVPFPLIDRVHLIFMGTLQFRGEDLAARTTDCCCQVVQGTQA